MPVNRKEEYTAHQPLIQPDTDPGQAIFGKAGDAPFDEGLRFLHRVDLGYPIQPLSPVGPVFVNRLQERRPVPCFQDTQIGSVAQIIFEHISSECWIEGGGELSQDDYTRRNFWGALSQLFLMSSIRHLTIWRVLATIHDN